LTGQFPKSKNDKGYAMPAACFLFTVNATPDKVFKIVAYGERLAA
jgi:hypothetical protein